MGSVGKGMTAGLAATAVLSMIMVAKGMMGLIPELDVIAMLSNMMGSARIIGWAAHFMIGVIAWGAGFALVFDVIPGWSSVSKGIAFSFVAWLMMMLVIMPMTGAGVFGDNIGKMAPALTLMMHAVFGAVLGVVYGRLGGSPSVVTIAR